MATRVLAVPRSLTDRIGRALACAGLAFCLLIAPGGCTVIPCADSDCVAARVALRTGHSLGPAECPGGFVLPNGASFDDGLTEDEAVLIALWNNAAFRATLTELDVAHAELVQAGVLPNPEVLYFFSAPDKPYKYAFELPLEALWLRPLRIKAAQRESARVCERLTQSALDLMRDVRQGYADVLLAKGRLRVAHEAVAIREQIARLAEARLRAGDISVQEATTARIDLMQARQDVARIQYDGSLEEERLRNLLGLGANRWPLVLNDQPPPVRADLDVERLAQTAVASRPDALAAEQGAAAAAERLRLSRLSWVRFLGLGDATSGRRTGHEFSPAFRVTLPLFDWNQGNIARAEAAWEQAQRQRQAVHDQIVLDVHQSYYRYEQARTELDILERVVRPEVEAAIRRAEAAYREGDTPYVVVLQTTRQLLDARVRQEQLHAELRRAWAELERSVGQRLSESHERCEGD
jgi:cobalt-zinc-cadmium efflux system outer membrane protein